MLPTAWFYNELDNPPVERRRLRFTEQRGAQVKGIYIGVDGSNSSFTGTLSGTNSIRILLDDGTIDFAGSFSQQRRSDEKFPGWLSLIARGSMTGLFEFNYYDPY